MSDKLTKLENIHKAMLSGAISIENASNDMQTDMKDVITYYINIGLDGKEKDLNDDDKMCIFLIIQIAQYIYNYSGFPTGLSDQDYDIIYEMYINFGNEDIVSVDLPFDTKETANHSYPSLRGTLTKIYYLNDNEIRKNPSRKYLSEWISSREHDYYDKTGKKINLNNEDVYVFPKWDGVSTIFEFNPDGSLKLALTRGNVYTNVAQNITKSFPTMTGEKTPNGYGLKTEIMMKEKDLEYFNTKYGTKYKNTRSVVSSILNSDELDERNELLVIQKLRRSDIVNGVETLQYLDDFVFSQPFIRCKLKDIDKIAEFAESVRYVDGLRCDGAVIYIINKEIQEVLGREDNKNKYEVAYKFTEEAKMTKLKDIIFQVGLFGLIAPVAVVKPVKMKGNEINRVSLGSMTRFESLKLRKGDKVKILYDIIPYMVFDSNCSHNEDGKLIKAPKHCPECNEKLIKNDDGVYYKCVNPDCPCRKKGAILNYINKIGIKNISYGIVDTLYKNKLLMNIEDLYKLPSKYKEIVDLDGFGDTSASLIIDSIMSHNVIPDYQLLGAIGIDDISTKTFQKILAVYPLDRLMSIARMNDVDELNKVGGIKDKKAKKVINGLLEKEKLISNLMSRIKVTHPIMKSNFKVVFTKVRDETIEREIEKRGGEVSEQLTKDVDYLVVPSLSVNSGKVEKAKKYGIRIVQIDDIIGELDRR